MTLLTALAACFGCSAGAPIKALPSVLDLEAYESSGELKSKRSIDSNDQIYRRLSVLLDQETGKWSRSAASYKTGPFVLRGEGLIIRCYQDMLVVDVLKNGKSTSYKRNIPGVLVELGLPL